MQSQGCLTGNIWPLVIVSSAKEKKKTGQGPGNGPVDRSLDRWTGVWTGEWTGGPES